MCYSTLLLLAFFLFFFFFNDTATTEIYTLSLHDALPILRVFVAEQRPELHVGLATEHPPLIAAHPLGPDRKSTRLNSSHTVISYAVFCLKKKKKKKKQQKDNKKTNKTKDTSL